MKTHLDLFSGIGGFALAASWAGFQTIGFCENEDYPRRVLSARFPGVPIHGDIRELNGEQYRGVSLITGGFPCQPFSVAGQQAGKTDDRYLWPEMLRVIAQAQPDWVVAENVTGIVSMELDQVLADLEGEGYACGTVIVPACAVDAPHRRDRTWIVGHTNEQRRHGGSGEIDQTNRRGQSAHTSQDVGHPDGKPLQRDNTKEGCGNGLEMDWNIMGGCNRPEEKHLPVRSGQNVADTDSQGLERHAGNVPSVKESGRIDQEPNGSLATGSISDRHQWATEPAVGRVANGIPNRVDRLKGLGNAIVPQVAYEILRLLIEK